MSVIIKVGMADLKVTRHPNLLTTLGLGSCIGICLYDSTTKIIGMAHIMLPSSKAIRNNTNSAKFADTAIVKLISDMQSEGANVRRIVAKIAGGAQMFKFTCGSDMMKIGSRNTEAVIQVLNDLNIKIIANDTGGSFGRTIEFNSDNGKLLIKTIGHGVKEI